MRREGLQAAYELPFSRTVLPRHKLTKLVRGAIDYSVIVTKDWRSYGDVAAIIQEERRSKVSVVMTRAKDWRQILNAYRVEKITF